MSLRRRVKRHKTSDMDELNRELNRFWKSQLKECAQRATVCKHSGTCKVTCGQLGKTNLMGNFKLQKKNKLNSQKLMRWDVHIDSHRRGIFWNEQNSRTIYHVLKNHGENYDSLNGKKKKENNNMPKGRKVNWCVSMWLNYSGCTTAAVKYIIL